MTTTLARPATPPAVHAARFLLRTYGSLMLFFWAIVLVAVVVVTAILAAYGITHISVMSFGRQAGMWFPFSIQILVATSYLRAHVAAGMTRRTFAWAALAVATAVAVLNATVMATALLVDRLVHGWLGWDWVLQDAALDPSGGSWPAMMLDYGTTYLVTSVSGLLVGIVYYAAAAARGPVAGGWWGTLLLPLTAGPVFVVLGLISGLEGPWPDRAAAYLVPNVGSAIAIGLGFAVLMALAFTLVARHAAVVRPRT